MPLPGVASALPHPPPESLTPYWEAPAFTSFPHAGASLPHSGYREQKMPRISSWKMGDYQLVPCSTTLNTSTEQSPLNETAAQLPGITFFPKTLDDSPSQLLWITLPYNKPSQLPGKTPWITLPHNSPEQLSCGTSLTSLIAKSSWITLLHSSCEYLCCTTSLNNSLDYSAVQLPCVT